MKFQISSSLIKKKKRINYHSVKLIFFFGSVLNFDTYVYCDNHHHKTQNISITPKKSMCYPFKIFPYHQPLTPGTPDLFPLTVVLSFEECQEWSHTECNILSLAPFTYYNALEIHPSCVCMSVVHFF